jgi:hypothetical protein
MDSIASINIAALRRFHLDIRDKAAVKDLLYRLDVRPIGWNVSQLCDVYIFLLGKSVSKERYIAGLAVLVATFVSAEGEKFLEDKSAKFDPWFIDKSRFVTFVERFVEELKLVLARDSESQNTRQRISARPRGIFDIMEERLYAELLPRNPTIPVITAFMLMLIANLFFISIQKESGAAIANNLWARIATFES